MELSAYFKRLLICASDLDLGVVGNGGLAVFAGYRHFENAKVVLGHGCRIAIPVVEVANEVCSQSIGRPFAIYDVAIWLHIEAILLVALRNDQL
jgi:hypothetical protein